jgi:hypothetical protein
MPERADAGIEHSILTTVRDVVTTRLLGITETF